MTNLVYQRSHDYRMTVSSLLQLLLSAGLLFTFSCGAQVKREVVFEQTITLPSGRFVGPIEINLPRKENDPYVVYEIETQLNSECAPRIRIEYPDAGNGVTTKSV